MNEWFFNQCMPLTKVVTALYDVVKESLEAPRVNGDLRPGLKWGLQSSRDHYQTT